jgi:hypothetical protein
MFRYRTRTIGKEIYLFCSICGTGLWLTNGRELFCPVCKKGDHSERGEKPESIHCCSNCGDPLQATSPSNGGYCEKCQCNPPMWDTIRWKFCSEKDCLGLLEFEKCSICGKMKKTKSSS